jgi:hypothetical protein
MTYEDPSVTLLRQKAKEYGIPESEVLKAWEEMKTKHHLPPYVKPALEIERGSSNTVVLVPAVNINLLSRLDKEVPNWESIKQTFPRI